MSSAVRAALADADVQFGVSAVTAYEYEELRVRNRLGGVDNIGILLSGLNATLLDFPGEAYRLLPLLPMLHKDPTDRMLIAHAIHADLTLVTADTKMREYPVRSLW
ncbi:type II toxin-antitoxin system VapC family toxin [Sphingomonas lenta]|uniref:type II toxin-antitoxin system VapC family toxin n=1 Tax=Sphingomonas lenta TaxID=1141887 RepID=UPI001FE3E62E|nr:type II toxin-antitoxin system VapC family toxin [Sphingomonas lenta]